MKPEEQRIEIAKACGWTKFTPGTIQYTARRADGLWGMIPDYPNDLNAMHEAEKLLTDDQWDREEGYLDQLEIVTGTRHMKPGATRVHAATAAQRAEALLKTLNLWKP